jgi:phosphatidylglycerophosphate synthase
MPRISGENQTAAEPNALTIANGVTMVRAAIALCGGGLFLRGGADRAALACCAAAMLLDAADGWIARRWRHETLLGTLIDPIADKIAVLVVFGTIALRSGSPAVWILFALGTLRDAGVTATRLALVGPGRLSARPDGFGKIKTACQYMVGLGILSRAVCFDSGFSYSSPWVAALVGASVGLSWFSWARYGAWRRRRDSRRPAEERADNRRTG